MKFNIDKTFCLAYELGSNTLLKNTKYVLYNIFLQEVLSNIVCMYID